jgi:type VI secretion system secreted protein VgrG
VDAEHTLLVGEGRDDGQAEISVSRKYLLSSGSVIRIRAEDSIVLSAGDSMIELTPRGIVLSGKVVELRGSESLSASGRGPTVRLDDEAEIVSRVVKIYSEEASIELDKDASVKGTRVLLNCDGRRPRDRREEGEAPETRQFSLKLTDERYEPYAGKKYRMLCEGEKFEGTTAADGRIAHEVLKSAKTAQITVWLGEYPTGAIKRYAVQIEDLPDPGSIAGAQVRLKNLGYYRGAGKGVIDDETRAALRSFQRDHALAPSGELDEATQDRLVERHES